MNSGFDFTRSRSQILVVQGVRLIFLTVILAITLIFQALQPEFVNSELVFPVYSMMAFMYIVNAISLGFFESWLKYWVLTAGLFFLESTFITGLIYFTGVNQSIFLFLYLVNIILCGFVFGRRGAFVLSLWTSILFSALLIFGPEMKGQTLFFAIGLNNIAFFAVSFLSGILSEQLNFMGSELQERGRDLRALKNLNRLILENIATGLVTIDETGTVVQGNRAAAEILDLLSGDLVGERIDRYLDNIFARIQTLNLAMGTTRSFEKFDWIYKNPDGDKLILEISVSALVDDENHRTGHVLAFQDSTKVRRLEYQMRQSEKLAAVGQLAAGIAHEIRNPLASISGSIQLLGDSFSSRQEEEKKLMSIVLKEIDRLDNLITEFLDYVRPDQVKDDPVDINALMREILDMVKLNKKLRVETEQIVALEGKLLINGHRDKLKQALLNIVINAYQAMNETASPKIEVRSETRGNLAILTIRDYGMGIEENRLRKIFEPFHTTKPKGTGLGLAVVHKVIESHSGKIFVESTKGIGTEFHLEFPVRSDNLGLAETPRATEDLNIEKKRGNG